MRLYDQKNFQNLKFRISQKKSKNNIKAKKINFFNIITSIFYKTAIFLFYNILNLLNQA